LPVESRLELIIKNGYKAGGASPLCFFAQILTFSRNFAAKALRQRTAFDPISSPVFNRISTNFDNEEPKNTGGKFQNLIHICTDNN
jgi:hypothetical protein